MKEKFLGIICFLYSFLIIYAIIFDKLKNFLAPNMQIYIKLSLIPLLIMGFIIMKNKTHYKFKISDLILLLPLFMIITAQDGRLSSSFASNRVKSIKKQTETVKKENKKEKIEEVKEVTYDKDNLNIDFDIIDENYYDLSSFISYPGSNVNNYLNKFVKIKGMALKKLRYIPDGYFMIGKYAITCCAADAEFAGFYVKLDDYDIKENDWYEIEGILKNIKYEGINIMVLNIININKIDGSKEEQYVYPCYSYGDGSCKEFTKYELKK